MYVRVHSASFLQACLHLLLHATDAKGQAMALSAFQSLVKMEDIREGVLLVMERLVLPRLREVLQQQLQQDRGKGKGGQKGTKKGETASTGDESRAGATSALETGDLVLRVLQLKRSL
uniref:Uncharacterized protein n=1 Tax=Chromera velia CCMP2878 TaxID=1169474 RepID=A0A0G4G3P9_9ALVE|eukprot:Cvel_20048.t1-p1 / transcript=Cvel_20048.t1 / gene=Cvel_20048 / organism=Chromera_velia_CCMP2878 / gene_product=hypothetical protein / transcript_product=hypothetical protein / location=Cvel_scaffold1772:19050-19625(-) / protein_length=117 / sequence_SO=supercontig / SO=protein_coding / is_pseudo=false